MFRDVQDWGVEGRQREVIKRQQNAEYLAGLRAQIESQKLRKRRDRFEPAAIEPTKMPNRNPAIAAAALPEDFNPPPVKPPARLPAVVPPQQPPPQAPLPQAMAVAAAGPFDPLALQARHLEADLPVAGKPTFQPVAPPPPFPPGALPPQVPPQFQPAWQQLPAGGAATGVGGGAGAPEVVVS